MEASVKRKIGKGREKLYTKTRRRKEYREKKPGVEIALIRLSGLSKKLSGQVDRPAEVIRRTSR